MAIDIFLSHSSRDAELAKALVELLRNALNVPANRIRCTSVSGYKLDVGADTDEQLRLETVEATILVGLITDVSIDSAYVLFELGARWGAKKFLAPLLGAGRGAEILAGPLAGLNALSCTREDLFQLVVDLAKQLETEPESPDVYSTHLDTVVRVSGELAAQRGLHEAEKPVAEENSTLTDLQCDYLMEISLPRNNGFIYGGLDDHTGRDVAPYQEAMEVYQALTLMRYGDGGYRLTPRGWSLADQLWHLRILDAFTDKRHLDEKELAQAAKLTDGETDAKELRRHLGEMEEKGLVKVTKTMHGWTIGITDAGRTHQKHRPLSVA
ncbi:MAG: toll/interleukin-1 receptor domain-containing protein [Pirellulales bacterium]|nr:toll/interleukin-1 receptor domain-containing protein [Pirellulales bacterium]